MLALGVIRPGMVLSIRLVAMVSTAATATVPWADVGGWGADEVISLCLIVLN